jgi:hypothetical protein
MNLNYTSYLMTQSLSNQSIIEKTLSENLPCPLFAKEGKFLPFAKGGKEGLERRCLDNYGLLSNSPTTGLWLMPYLPPYALCALRHALCAMRYALNLWAVFLYSAFRNPCSALRGANFFMDDPGAFAQIFARFTLSGGLVFDTFSKANRLNSEIVIGCEHGRIRLNDVTAEGGEPMAEHPLADWFQALLRECPQQEE